MASIKYLGQVLPKKQNLTCESKPHKIKTGMWGCFFCFEGLPPSMSSKATKDFELKQETTLLLDRLD